MRNKRDKKRANKLFNHFINAKNINSHQLKECLKMFMINLHLI